LLHMLCVVLGASLFLFFLFAVINGWIPAYFFWRRHTPFSLRRTL
jgi:Na+-transporting NADH:ubiquinone oxidoreductase subunit NqrB